MNLRSHLTDPPNPIRPWYRWVRLATGLIMLALDIRLREQMDRTYPVGDYLFTVMALMLIIGVVAWDFRWPKPVAAALRVLDWAWLAFVFYYLFFHALSSTESP